MYICILLPDWKLDGQSYPFIYIIPEVKIFSFYFFFFRFIVRNLEIVCEGLTTMDCTLHIFLFFIRMVNLPNRYEKIPNIKEFFNLFSKEENQLLKGVFTNRQ